MPKKLSELLQELEKVYSEIPSFDCSPCVCNECCGPVQWELIEELNIRRYLNKHHMKYLFKKLTISDPTCPYSIEKACSIYPVRPLICRCFGVVRDPIMHCPMLPKPEKTISVKHTQDMLLRIRLLSDKLPQSTADRVEKWRKKHEPT